MSEVPERVGVHPIVQTAAKAIRARLHVLRPDECSDCDASAEVAAPAVLRAVADAMPPAWSGAPEWLRREADKIERGSGVREVGDA